MKILVLGASIGEGKLWTGASNFIGIIPEAQWPSAANPEALFVKVGPEYINFGDNRFDGVMVSPGGEALISDLHGVAASLYLQQIRNQLPVGGWIFFATTRKLEVRKAAGEAADIKAG